MIHDNIFCELHFVCENPIIGVVILLIAIVTLYNLFKAIVNYEV